MMGKVKELPYGIPKFETVIKDGYYMVDKTRFIPRLEKQAANLFLIRPRRFGKSLFLQMLEVYYDVKKKNRFQEYFGDLWIGSHPTEWQGKYLVLSLDFSKVSAPLDNLEEDFNTYVSIQLDAFVRKYKEFFPEDFLEEYRRIPLFAANAKLNIIETEAKNQELRLYLIVDEYDNFTNIVLSQHGEGVYRTLTHAEGFYRGVFKKFKGMFSRIFMMGISPITLDDLTSGFNIGWHISHLAEFNTMLGFSEQDVREMLRYYKDNGYPVGDIEVVVDNMKPWYDNYCFATRALDTDPKMFNCDMVLYYINALLQTGLPPETMVSPNVKTDYNKMRNLINLDTLDGNRKGLLQQIADNGYIYENVCETYPALDLIKPSMFVSQLYYYGMLTITGTYGYMQILSIPNNNIRQQYYMWMLEHYGSAEKAIDVRELNMDLTCMALEGNWRPALEYIANSYAENSVVRSTIEGERNVQGYFHAYLSLCRFYLTAPEMEFPAGFTDLFLMPDFTNYKTVAHSYIIEMKYMKTSATEEEACHLWQDAISQANKYANSHRTQVMCQSTTLHRIGILFRGRKLERMDEITE